MSAVLDAIAKDITAKINAIIAGGVSSSSTVSTITITSTDTTQRSSIHFLDAGSSNGAAVLKLGLENGGTEIDGAAAFRPIQSGTTATATLQSPVPPAGTLTIDVKRDSAPLATINLPIWVTQPTAPASRDELATQIAAALTAKASSEPYLAGATAQRIGDKIRILPGSADPNISFTISATGFTLGSPAENVARYAPGIGSPSTLRQPVLPATTALRPAPADLTGSEAAKTGIYALEDVDLFNLLCHSGASTARQCRPHRGDRLLHAPPRLHDSRSRPTPSTRSRRHRRGSAARRRRCGAATRRSYFPRMRAQDPLMSDDRPAVRGRRARWRDLRAHRCGARRVEGAGRHRATIVGAVGLSVHAHRSRKRRAQPAGPELPAHLPRLSAPSRGERARRAVRMQLTDEYKYIPVRRLALFLEESLYRGTQWAVFEPNDEPLWAQIRLNLGAFMHTLFSQGAFQGRTPRDAYFVKCDKETTTQNDIDLGRVNIVVGFAPLKPAEFVIIKIQQIAGAIQT